jgi:hypothetical protein
MVVLPRDFKDVTDPEMMVLNFASVVTGMSTSLFEPVTVALDPFVLISALDRVTPVVLATVPTIVVFPEASVAVPALPEFEAALAQ